jgi:hypothetical protein
MDFDPSSQMREIVASRNSPPLLLGHLEMLCTALVMEIEEYVRSFNAARALPQLIEIAAAPGGINGDVIVMALRAIALVLEHVPHSNDAAEALAAPLLSASAAALRRAKSLNFSQSPPASVIEEALRIATFMARDDGQGNALVLCPTLCLDIIHATEWGDQRTARLCLETLSVFCSKITFSPAPASATAKPSQERPITVDTALVNTVVTQLIPFLHNSLHASIAVFGTGDGSDWLHVEHSVQCLVLLVERISITFPSSNPPSAQIWQRATASARLGATPPDEKPPRKLSFSSLFGRKEKERTAGSLAQQPPQHAIESAMPSDVIRAMFAGLLAVTRLTGTSEVRSNRQMTLLSGLARVAAQRRECVMSQLASDEAIAFFAQILHTERVDALSLLDDPFRLQSNTTQQQPRGLPSAASDASPTFATLWLIHCCFPFFDSTYAASSPASSLYLVPVHQWEWEDDLHAFTKYNEEQCLVLDTCLLRKQTQVQVRLSGGRTYMLDLALLKQSRASGGGNGRNVRRSFAPISFAFVSDDLFLKLRPSSSSVAAASGATAETAEPQRGPSHFSGPIPVPALDVEGLPSDAALAALGVLLGPVAGLATVSSVPALRKLGSLVILQLLQANLPPTNQQAFAYIMNNPSPCASRLLASSAAEGGLHNNATSATALPSPSSNVQLICEYIIETLALSSNLTASSAELLENSLLMLDWLVHGSSGLTGRQASNSSFGDAAASSAGVEASLPPQPVFSFAQIAVSHGALPMLDAAHTRIAHASAAVSSGSPSRPVPPSLSSFIARRIEFLRQVLAETFQSGTTSPVSLHFRSGECDDQLQSVLVKMTAFAASHKGTRYREDERDNSEDLELSRSVGSSLLVEFMTATLATAPTTTAFQWSTLGVAEKLFHVMMIIGPNFSIRLMISFPNPEALRLLIEKMVAVLPAVLVGLPLVEGTTFNRPVVCRSVREALKLLAAISPQMQTCSRKPPPTPEPTPPRNESATPAAVVVDLRTLCPAGHRLSPMRMSNHWSCDVCHENFPPTSDSGQLAQQPTVSLPHSCRICNFDICGDCFMNDAIGYEGGEPSAAVEPRSSGQSPPSPFLVRRAAAKGGLEESRNGGHKVHLLASVGDFEQFTRCAAELSSVTSSPSPNGRGGVRAMQERLSRRIGAALTGISTGISSGSAAAGTDIRSLVRQHLALEDAEAHHAETRRQDSFACGSDTRRRERQPLLAHERIDMYYDGIGRCSMQETILSMLFRKAASKKLAHVLHQFECCITVLDKSSTTGQEPSSPVSPTSNENWTFHTVPSSPASPSFQDPDDLMATPPRASSSSSAHQPSKMNIQEFADSSTTRSRVFYFHEFASSEAQKCFCGAHGRADFAAEANRWKRREKKGPPFLRDTRLLTKCYELAVLSWIFRGVELMERHSSSSAFTPAAAEEEEDDADLQDSLSPSLPSMGSSLRAIFESPEVTQLVLRSLHASALRVAILPAQDAVPRWVHSVLSCFPFLIPLRIRCRIAQFFGGGAQRSLWGYIRELQLIDPTVEVMPTEWVGAPYSRGSPGGNNATPTAGDSAGREFAHKHVARRGPPFLLDALGILSSSLCRRFPLAVSFAGENGTGSGPTIQFFTKIARELAGLRFARLWRGVASEATETEGKVLGRNIEIPTQGLYPVSCSGGERSLPVIPDIRNPLDFTDETVLSPDQLAEAQERNQLLSAMQSPVDTDFLHILMPTSPSSSNTPMMRSSLSDDIGELRPPSGARTAFHNGDGDRDGDVDDEDFEQLDAPVVAATEDVHIAQQRANAAMYFVGACLGRCFLDQQVFPMPFSRSLIDMLLHGMCPATPPLSSPSLPERQQLRLRCAARQVVKSWDISLLKFLELVDPDLHRVLRSISRMSLMYEDAGAGSTQSQEQLAQIVRELDLVFVSPGDDRRELISNGATTAVTIENAEEYVELCCNDVAVESVVEQLQALHQGFYDTIPTMITNLLSPREFSRLVLGDQDSEYQGTEPLWSKAEFSAAVFADHGYTKESPVVKMFVDLVSDEFDRATQQKFLEFSTGCPRLPMGGIQALGKITIVRREQDLDPCDARVGKDPWGLVTVNTCFRYIKLPPYPTREIMRAKVLLSIHEAGDKFELS